MLGAGKSEVRELEELQEALEFFQVEKPVLVLDDLLTVRAQAYLSAVLT